MKRILVTGSTGMLGSDVVRTLGAVGRYDVYGLGRSISPLLPRTKQFQVDLAAPFPAHQVDIAPDVIIHTAALTDLNLCEQQPSLANQVHVEASRSIARLSGKKTLFIYISTDSVFNGKSGRYSEADVPDPLNIYARTKLAGEHAVTEENKGFTTIIRTNIYGLHSPLKNSLAEWAYKELTTGNSISGFTDTVFNAVFTGQLAQIIRFLIDQDALHPVLNVGSDTAINKYDFLKKFADALRVGDNLLKPAVSSDFPGKVMRPRNTSLDTSLLSTFHPVPDFDSGIHQWIEQAIALGCIKQHTSS